MHYDEEPSNKAISSMNDQNTQTRKLSRDELTVALSGWRQEDTVVTMLMGKLLRATVGNMLGRTNELLAERVIHCDAVWLAI